MIRRTTACVKDLSELSSLRGEKRNKFDAKTARSGSIVCVPSDGSSFLHLLVFASVWSSEYNRGWGHVHGWVDAISWPPENFLSFGQRSHCSCTPTRHHAGRAKLPEPKVGENSVRESELRFFVRAVLDAVMQTQQTNSARFRDPIFHLANRI